MKKTIGFVLAVALLSAQKAPITPGKATPTLVKREVDLRSCAWIEFKNARNFQVRVSDGQTYEVSVERPQFAQCVEW